MLTVNLFYNVIKHGFFLLDNRLLLGDLDGIDVLLQQLAVKI